MTKVVNLRCDPYDVYIGRAGKGKDGYFGNPYPISSTVSRDESIERYIQYFHGRLLSDKEFKRRILELKNKTIGCFCKPERCHGDIIAAYLNEIAEPIKDKK